jgi:sugar diacid utilization regulator
VGRLIEERAAEELAAGAPPGTVRAVRPAAGDHGPAALEARRDSLHPDVAVELLRADGVSALLSTAVRAASRLLATHIAFVMLLDADGKVLRLEASVGHRTPTFTTIVRPVQAITAVGSGRPVQSADFLNDSRLDHDPPTDDIIRKEGMRTVLAVPLQAGGEMLGALYVGHREPRHFPAAEVDELVALAEQVSTALARALREQELARRLDQSQRESRMAQNERDLLTRAEAVRRAVMSRTREQEGISAAAVGVAEALERPVLVTDWKLAPVAQAAGRSGVTFRSASALVNRVESRDAVALCAESHGPVAAGKDWRVAPIEAGGDVLGYLWVGPSADTRSEGRLVETVMDRVLPILALELLTKGDSERRQRGDFIYELLAERVPDFAVLEARAAAFWSGSGEPHRPIVVGIGEAVEQWGSRLETARRIVAAARPNDLATIYGRQLVLFVAPPARDSVEAALADVRQLLARSRLTMTAVVGGECRGLRETREATLAALRLNDLLVNTGVLWAEGLEALAYLFDPDQTARLESMCRAALAPLGHRERLLDALHAYYEAGGNKADAARRLRLHVNTLRQRLERAEQLVGGSVDESVRAVPLRLALLVRHVRRGAAPTVS